MSNGRTRRLLREMFREEWRLHSHLFGGSRFAFFPVVIALLAAGTTTLLVTTGTDSEPVFAGLHALAFVFGLHTGSIGFLGRDALRNLLGDVTLVVFSARTLPLSRNRSLTVFVLKDVVYYALLFLLPITIGTVPVLVGSPLVGSPLVGPEGLSPASVGSLVVGLWATLTLTFGLGIGTTIAGIGFTRRVMSLPRVLVASAVVAVTALWAVVALVGSASIGFGSVGFTSVGSLASAFPWDRGIDAVVAYTPYGLFLEPTLPRLVATIGSLVAVFLVAVVTFDVDADPRTRTQEPSFRRWWRRIGDPLTAKTLLDVHRSTGGLGKVFFSAAILFGVTAALVDLAGRITGVEPSVGISFGAVLGLTGFTTYNWLTQYDDVDSYLVHPVTVRDVFDAKFRAFLALGPLVGLGFYGVAIVWQGGPIAEALVGGVLLVGVACYVFGTTVSLTGVSPNEFLFDAKLFAGFGIAVVVPLVPILVVGFALSPVSSTLLAGLGVIGIALGVIGVFGYRRSVPKWTTRYRRR